MAGYAWHIGDLIDGSLSHEVPVIDQGTSWQSVMDDAGTFSITVALSDPAVRKLNLRTSAEPTRCFLAVAYTDKDGTETFIDGGPIWGHSYDGTSKQLTIRASGLWSLWDHRYIIPVLAAGQSPASVSVTESGLSLATIAKRLLQLAFTHTGGSVPVVLPGDETGSSSRTYNGYEMPLVGQALRDLTASDGGPEIQFIPRRQAADPTKIEWLMRAGTTEQPLLSQLGGDWVWDLSAKHGSASGLTVTREGSPVTSRQWEQGSGTDVSMLFGRADNQALLDAGFPLLEALDGSHTTVSVQATLDGYASADLAQAARPAETWTFKVQRDEDPKVGTYRVGDWAVVTTKDDPYVPDGDHQVRITSIGGDTSNQITIAAQPEVL